MAALLEQRANVYLVQDLRLNESHNGCQRDVFVNAIQNNTLNSGSNETKSPFWIFTNSPDTRRGVTIVIKKTPEIKSVELCFKDEEGNAILVRMHLTYGDITIISIYGPNETNKEFFKKVAEQVRTIKKNELLVLGGDWNVVPSNLPVGANPDLINSLSVPNEANAARVRGLISEHNLVDTYRILNNPGKAYTFKHFSGNRMAKLRLDFFLTKEMRYDDRVPVFKSRILPRLCLRFDHRVVELTLTKKSLNQAREDGKRREKKQHFNDYSVLKEALMIIFAYSTVQTAIDHLATIRGVDVEWLELANKLKDWKRRLIRLVTKKADEGRFFIDWKNFRHEEWFEECERTIGGLDWNELWGGEGWEGLEGSGMMGNVVLCNGFHELCRFSALVDKY